MIGLFTRLARVRRLDHGEEATLVEHLTELRDRLIACVVVLGVVFAVAFWRYHDLFDILNGPLPHKLQESKPITTEIGEAFTLTILISVYTALLITFPFTLYQLYAYLIPAFSSDTAKRIKPCCCSSRCSSPRGRPSATSSSCPRPCASSTTGPRTRSTRCHARAASTRSR